MEASSLCQVLTWDSEFFARRIAQITVDRLNEETIERIKRWCDVNRIDCAYFLSNAADKLTVRLAEDNGLRFVDIRVTLEKELDQKAFKKTDIGEFDICSPDDVPALQAIAGVSHRDSRFYQDPNFSIASCSAMYQTWVDNSSNGYDDVVLVTRLEGRPVGYISCQVLDQNKGRIGLLGVAAEAQGRGVGQRLMSESFRWFAQQGVKQIKVVTQGRNIAAQRLYQRNEFVTASVELWYHWWFQRPGTVK